MPSGVFFDDQRAVVGVAWGLDKLDFIRDVPGQIGERIGDMPKRNAWIAGGTLVALVAGATTVVVHSQGPELTLVSQVTEDSVSTMVTAKGVAAAANSANLSFKRGDNISKIYVKVGDKVKKNQLLGELGTTSVRQALLTAEGTWIQQQAALDLILNDVNPLGLERIYNRAKDVADQAKKNIQIRQTADKKAYQRLKDTVDFDNTAIVAAMQKLDTDACTQRGIARPNASGAGVASPLFTGPAATPLVPPATGQTSKSQQACAADYDTLSKAKQTKFKDRTAYINGVQALKVNRSGLRSTYRAALQALWTAYNTWNIARVNRPNQILAQKALVQNALANVITAQSGLKNSYVYAPNDGTVSAIDGAVGEFSNGGNALSPATPQVPGSVARIPTVGQLASNDQRNPTNTNGTNLSAVNPAGGAFMTLTDLSTMQVIAAYPEADAAKITPGSLAKVTFDAFPATGYDGTVTAVSPLPVAGPEGKTMYYATVLLNQAPAQLKSGMAANLSVVVATVQNKAYVVPTNSVQTEGGKSYVMSPGTDGVPQKKFFTPGAVGNDNTAVKDGLKPGDRVMVPSTGPLPTADGDAPDAPAGDQPVSIVYNNPAPAQPAAQPAAAAPVAAPPAMDPSMGGDMGLGYDPVLDGPSPMGDDGMDGAQGGQIMAPSGSANAGQAGVNPFASGPAPSAGAGN